MKFFKKKEGEPVITPQIGEQWWFKRPTDQETNPFWTTYAVIVLDVKDGWVRYGFGERGEHMPSSSSVSIFNEMYSPVKIS